MLPALSPIAGLRVPREQAIGALQCVAARLKRRKEAKEEKQAADARRARNAMAADADLEEVTSALITISSVASKVAGARFWAPPSRPPQQHQQVVTQTGANVDAQDEDLATLKAKLAAALLEIP